MASYKSRGSRLFANSRLKTVVSIFAAGLCHLKELSANTNTQASHRLLNIETEGGRMSFRTV